MGVRTRLLFDGGLLIDGVELALLAQADAVLAATLGVAGRDETPDLPPSAMDCKLA